MSQPKSPAKKQLINGDAWRCPESLSAQIRIYHTNLQVNAFEPLKMERTELKRSGDEIQ
jgi:hypothetical protein